MQRSREFWTLWTLALLTYGVGDIVTTGVGVVFVPGIVERNAIVLWALETLGMPGFVAVKAVSFVLLMEISLIGDHEGDPLAYFGSPIAAVILGTSLTAWNLLNILAVT